jgi:hypothetical protein
MSPLTIESIAVAQLAEHRESAARLRVRREARSGRRSARRAAAPGSSDSRSMLSRLHLRSRRAPVMTPTPR